MHGGWEDGQARNENSHPLSGCRHFLLGRRTWLQGAVQAQTLGEGMQQHTPRLARSDGQRDGTGTGENLGRHADLPSQIIGKLAERLLPPLPVAACYMMSQVSLGQGAAGYNNLNPFFGKRWISYRATWMPHSSKKLQV